MSLQAATVVLVPAVSLPLVLGPYGYVQDCISAVSGCTMELTAKAI
jgi:hypothetical protein